MPQQSSPILFRTGGVGEGDPTLRINFHGGGFSFENYLDLSAMLPTNGEATAHKDDTGTIFVSEHGPSTGGAIVHEIDKSGTELSSFELPSRSGHPNGLFWFDDRLWVNDNEAQEVFRIDWDGSSSVVDGSFTWDGHPPMAVVPTTTGVNKFLSYPEDPASIYDPDAGISSGGVSGNIETQLREGFLGGTYDQAARWANGYLYFNTHRWVAKVPFPHADLVQPNRTPLSEDIEWICHPDIAFQELEQAAYDSDEHVFYMLDSQSKMLYRCEEGVVSKKGRVWNQWNLANGGAVRKQSLHLEASVSADLFAQDEFGFDAARAAHVETWVYDDGVTSANGGKDLKLHTFDSTNASGAIGIGIRTDHSNGDANYYVRLDATGEDSSTDWFDSGVARPSSAQWVKFAWHLTGNHVYTRISTDGGMTWQAAGDRAAGADTSAVLDMIVHGIGTGTARVGEWTIRQLYS